jgi:hypothetical protein
MVSELHYIKIKLLLLYIFTNNINKLIMKKILLLLTISIYCINTNAQDYIITLNGDEIKSKVIEVNISDIKYKKFENANGPIYSILKSEILFIKYENGTKEKYSTSGLKKKKIDTKLKLGIGLGFGNTRFNNLNNSEYYHYVGANNASVINFQTDKYRNNCFSLIGKYKIESKLFLTSQFNINLCKTDFNLSSFYMYLPDESNRKSRIISINLPVNILYDFLHVKLKSKIYKISGFAGPNLSYLCFDQIKKPDGNKLNSISALDLGLNFGLNVEMPENFFINFNYSIEAINLKNYKTGSELWYYYREDRIINQHLLGNRNSFIIQIGKYF